MKPAFRSLLLIFAVFSLVSCAAGQKIKYNDTVADISASGTKKVAVAVHDQRPYIVSGESSPDYVGLNRGGASAVPFKPHAVTTESGKPLADDFSGSISRSLAARGFMALAVSAAPNEGKDKVLAKMQKADAERLLILTLHEWQSDTYLNTGLFYDILLEIFDMNGRKLVEKSLKGQDDLPRPEFMWSGIEGMKATVPAAYKKKLEIIFSDKDITDSLR